ncbi:malto-oligosyltrehalose trehalohydrolase [Pseudomonas sp. PS02288]|uniref:malto-oligosyltrehalose trehalohydrolase n=1 Tax=Pseudomonas sp. PS02288 TaxID=2991443 RepID=UPI00249AB261|nr:malto-oligosyltrehalose trehalohydrolase [Pseudomonas sp. PS02288]
MAPEVIDSGRHGAVLLEQGKTRFSLWAPDARSVAVELDGGHRHPLEKSADGWFLAELPVGAGTRYQYRIDDDLLVPDPASRAQSGDVHSPSVVVDPQAYAWQSTDWLGRPWRETVLYELHVGLLGGYAGVEKHLPRLVELGVTAIELMPLNEFPGARNWGYDGVLPYAPEASYGTPDELKHLIDTAHGLGLMVFLDVVYNHFGPDGNYLGAYAKDFFNHDLHTPWGDAIDFRRSEVRDFFIDNALMWVNDYRFDGLRLDAVHAISERDFLVELSKRVRASLQPGRHVHLVLENENNASSLLENAFEAQWNDDGHNVLHVLLTGEHQGYYADYASDATAKLARCLGQGFIYQGNANRHGKSRGEPSGHLSPTAFVLFLQNHDQTGNRAFGDRLVGLVEEPRALRAATAVLLLSPMIPMLFMGEEWGAKQPFLFFTDHHGELAEAVREGRRGEFSEFAEFNDERKRALIPDPNAESTFEASRPDFAAVGEPEHAEWHALYKSLLALRHAQIVPNLAQAKMLGAEVVGDKAVVARWQLGERVLRIELNLGAEALSLADSCAAFEPIHESVDSAFDARAQGQLQGLAALVFWENRT